MGRPKGSKNKSKDGAIGDNGGPPMDLTDEQRQVLFFQPGGHLEKYKAALASKKAADAHLRNICKIAKSELGPTVIDDIKLAIEAETPEGEAAIKTRMESQVRLLRWLGLPIGEQGSLFPDVDLRPAVERARADGKRSGFKGERCSPPHDPSIPQYNAWMDGWQEGQSALLETKIRLPVQTIGTEEATFSEETWK